MLGLRPRHVPRARCAPIATNSIAWDGSYIRAVARPWYLMRRCWSASGRRSRASRGTRPLVIGPQPTRSISRTESSRHSSAGWFERSTLPCPSWPQWCGGVPRCRGQEHALWPSTSTIAPDARLHTGRRRRGILILGRSLTQRTGPLGHGRRRPRARQGHTHATHRPQYGRDSAALGPITIAAVGARPALDVSHRRRAAYAGGHGAARVALAGELGRRRSRKCPRVATWKSPRLL